MPQVFFVERILVLTPATFPQVPFSLGFCFCYYVPRWRTGFFVVVFTNPVAADVFVWLADFALIPATLLQAAFCVVLGGVPTSASLSGQPWSAPSEGSRSVPGLGSTRGAIGWARTEVDLEAGVRTQASRSPLVRTRGRTGSQICSYTWPFYTSSV